MQKRFRTLLLIIPLLATLTGVSGARAQIADPCKLPRREAETVRHHMKRLIRCAVETVGPVRGGAERAICIADRESNLQPKATSPTGMYLGLYQHAAEYWPDRFANWTEDGWTLRDDALIGRSNAVITIRMVHAAGGWRAAGWGGTGC